MAPKAKRQPAVRRAKASENAEASAASSALALAASPANVSADASADALALAASPANASGEMLPQTPPLTTLPPPMTPQGSRFDVCPDQTKYAGVLNNATQNKRVDSDFLDNVDEALCRILRHPHMADVRHACPRGVETGHGGQVVHARSYMRALMMRMSFVVYDLPHHILSCTE